MLAWCAATRTTKSGRKVAPAERLTLEQALRGITIDAAFGLNMDHEIGSIVAGKKADFTILEDDPFDLGVERLKDVRVAGTVFEGGVHLLPVPLASTLANDAEATRAGLPRQMPARAPLYTSLRARRARYRPAPNTCCGPDGDPCVFLRQLSGWMQEPGFLHSTEPPRRP